ncbi:glycosyl hydrolase family 71-domain-containing protein [Bisporella sp. PMI_857]|nr:glycosyl hydrolase family 71-domain-containing protein [Bisporella sp. PMI_857]
MHLSRAFLVLGLGATKAAALAVFAHFMVGNTLSYLDADWNADMTAAKLSGIDAFALNIAKGEAANAQINLAFSVANTVGFKLFFSFDYAERSHGTWGQAEVTALINTWKGSSAYYQHLSKPLVSTFEGPEFASQWGAIKSATGCFFVPDYSSKGARDGLLMAPGVPDGLFSWAAWPAGTIGMNTYGDASYMQFLAQAGKPTYMMPISPAFYTNLPNYNKNWLWQGDDLWFVRWVQVLFLTQVQTDFAPPVFAQIISWNDYGESHYIGPITAKATYAITNGGAPFNYVTNRPHDGFRSFLPFLTSLAKTGVATVGTQKVTIWYRNSAATACDQAGTVGNTCSQYQIEYAPGALAQDKIFYSALLGAPATVTISIGADTWAGVWAETPATGVGIYHGSADVSGRTGQVKVTVAGIATAVGAVSIGDCTKVNFNPYVYTENAGSSSASVDIRNHVCIRGYGAGSFFNICQFSCKIGYCPVTACVCTKIGPPPAMPTPLFKNGYPTDGNRNFDGLCGFAVNYGYKGTECSTTKPASPFTPTKSPFL